MPRRAAMWPTELTDNEGFTQLTALTQRLFQFLWLHSDLNAGGFIAYQPAVWANQAPDLTVDSINASVDEMAQRKVAAVDPATGELLLRGFIRYDSSRKPNVYLNSMRAAQTARSPRLRQIAWEDIQRIHPPPMERDPKKAGDEKYEERIRTLERERDKAYEELRARVEVTVPEPSPNGLRTLREPHSVSEPVSVSESGKPALNSKPRTCTCGKYPDVGDLNFPGLCAVCITRERQRQGAAW